MGGMTIPSRVRLTMTAMLFSHRSIAILALLLLPAAAASSQSASPQPSFDAATIKPTDKADPANGYWSLPGIGRFFAHSLSVQYLIQLAYGIEPNQISGKPAWLDSDFYDIDAKPEEGIKLSPEELEPRLQSLLIERFHLAAHFETRQVRGYALVAAKGGTKLQPTRGDHSPGWRINVSTGHLEGLNWSMTYLASAIQRVTKIPVADETGITGSYDIRVQYAPEDAQDSALPSIFTALRETLGLELKARQVPMRVLVIDHIDRVPVAN